eukprot:PhF_6_TR41832/c0_g1_i1/m.63435
MICNILCDNVVPLGLSTLVQFFTGAIYFVVLSEPYKKSLSVDKGVCDIFAIRQIYPLAWCFLGSIVTAAVRACAILLLASVFSGKIPSVLGSGCLMCAYLSAALSVTALSGVPKMEEALYAQRPYRLILINVGHNLSCALVGSFVLFFSAF